LDRWLDGKTSLRIRESANAPALFAGSLRMPPRSLRKDCEMSDPYSYFFKKLLIVSAIYLGVMAELGFLKGAGVL
jgi:hypothetical protein